MQRFNVLIFCILLTLGLTTPHASALNINYGLKAGISTADISGDAYENTTSRSGFLAGVFVNAGILSIVELQVEVLYAQKGAIFNQTLAHTVNDGDIGIFTESTFSSEIETAYIDIPVVASIGIFNTQALNVALIAGPYAAFNLSGTITSDLLGEADESDIDNLADMTYGALAGLAVDVGAPGIGNVSLEFRYALGLSNFNEDPQDGNIAAVPDGKNRVFSVLVGIGI